MKRLALITSLAMILAASTALAADRYKVIVNKANPTASLTKAQVSQLFMKKTTVWEGWSQKASPIDLTADSAVRESFTKSIFNKPVSSVKSYWQQQIFSGRNVPPVEVETDAQVLAFVAKTAGAVGYVANDTSLPSSVKEINVE